jgi:hypothetical protein
VSSIGRRRIPIAAWAAGGLVVVAAVAVAATSVVLGMAGPAGPPRFVEETAKSGVDHAYDGAFTYFVGGGVAVFDCDDDGKLDLFLAGGTNPAALYRNVSPTGGALRFEPSADPAVGLRAVTGGYPLDIDGDRRTDLAVLRLGEDVLLRGLGGCRFERANEALGFDGGDAWTAAFSATWEGDARLPTLAFGNYVELDEAEEGTGRCSDSALYRPAGTATTYGEPIALSPSWCTLSMLFSDWDRSGRRDLRVSNDRHYYSEYSDGQEQLCRIAPGEPPREYTAEDGWQRLRIWGMGIASHDLTGDGYPEVYLTSQSDNKLQTLADGPTRPNYRDIALQSGVIAHMPFTGGDPLPSTAWHAEFADVNNDSLMDLFVAKGNVESMPDYAAKDPSNLLIGRPDGTFVEGAEEAGILNFARGRGAALADLNLDGLLDLVEVNRRQAVKLWRNVGSGDATSPAPMGHWVAIRLDQDGPNHDAIGAWIAVRSGDRNIEREVTVGGGHAGGQLGWVHFGLGGRDAVEVRVIWPDGEVGPWLPIGADGFAIVERGASDVRGWTPPG